MAYQQAFYTRQEQVDAQTTRLDNPNVVGSGYINFGAMERLPASEALASNWQFAAGQAEAQPLPGAGAFGMPLVGAGAEWAVPAVPRAMPLPPSAADRSSNWRDRNRFAAEAAALDAFATPAQGLDPTFGSGLVGSAAQLGMGLGMGMGQPLGQAAALGAHMQALSLGGGPLASALPMVSAAFPSALTVLPQSAGDALAYPDSAAAAPMGAPGGFLNAGQCGASYGAQPMAHGASSAAGAYPAARHPSDPYHQPFLPATAVNGLGAVPSSAALRPPMPAEARRGGGYGGVAGAGGHASLAAHAATAPAPSHAYAEPSAAGAKKPLTQEDYAAAAKAWKPPKASTVLVTPTAAKAEPAKGRAGKAGGPREWGCKRCSFINDGHARFCEMCQHDRIGGGEPDHGHDDGWKSTAAKGSSGASQPEQHGPAKSRASAKNEKRRAKKATKD